MLVTRAPPPGVSTTSPRTYRRPVMPPEGGNTFNLRFSHRSGRGADPAFHHRHHEPAVGGEYLTPGGNPGRRRTPAIPARRAAGGWPGTTGGTTWRGPGSHPRCGRPPPGQAVPEQHRVEQRHVRDVGHQAHVQQRVVGRSPSTAARPGSWSCAATGRGGPRPRAGRPSAGRRGSRTAGDARRRRTAARRLARSGRAAAPWASGRRARAGLGVVETRGQSQDGLAVLDHGRRRVMNDRRPRSSRPCRPAAPRRRQDE